MLEFGLDFNASEIGNPESIIPLLNYFPRIFLNLSSIMIIFCKVKYESIKLMTSLAKNASVLKIPWRKDYVSFSCVNMRLFDGKLD